MALFSPTGMIEVWHNNKWLDVCRIDNPSIKTVKMLADDWNTNKARYTELGKVIKEYSFGEDKN